MAPRALLTLAWTTPVAVLFAAQMLGDPGPDSPYLPFEPILYAVLLLLVSIIAGTLCFARSAFRQVRGGRTPPAVNRGTPAGAAACERGDSNP